MMNTFTKARSRFALGISAVAISAALITASPAFAQTTSTLRGMGTSLKVTATVTNTGQRRAHEVAQLYINDKVASLTQPVRALKGIRHLDLAPGQSATVEFTLTRADLAFVHQNLKTFAEAGTFDVWIAPSATGSTSATFELTA